MYLFTFLSFCTSNYLVGILLVLIGLPRFLLLFLSPTGDTAYPLCLDIGYYYTNHSKHLHSKQMSHSSLVCIVRSICDCTVKLCLLQKKKKILEMFLITYHRVWRSQTHPRAPESQSLPLGDYLKARRTKSYKVAYKHKVTTSTKSDRDHVLRKLVVHEEAV